MSLLMCDLLLTCTEKHEKKELRLLGKIMVKLCEYNLNDKN